MHYVIFHGFFDPERRPNPLTFWLPTSIDMIRPPIRLRASSIMKSDRPFFIKCLAADKPAIPAPIITISTCLDCFSSSFSLILAMHGVQQVSTEPQRSYKYPKHLFLVAEDKMPDFLSETVIADCPNHVTRGQCTCRAPKHLAALQDRTQTLNPSDSDKNKIFTR